MARSTQHAAYGTACVNCARSKCRCFVPNPGEACERCRRLGKECVQTGSARKRSPKKLGVSKSSQLEAKIDGLVSLLTSSTESPTGVTVAHVSRAGIIDTRHATSPGLPPQSPEPIAPNASALSAAQVLLGIPADEDEEILEEFRAVKLVQFPFLFIPPGTSAAQLRSTRPFLWLCILAVQAKSTSKQSIMYSQIRTVIGQAMVGELDRDIQQLLGLLVCIAWGNFQTYRRPFVTIFIQLALSVVFDLGLNKTPPRGPDERAPYRFHTPWISKNRSMEERRALLACYYVSASASKHLQRIDTLRWTPHMDDCLKKLAESRECEGDAVLAVIVKLRNIVEKNRRLEQPEGQPDDTPFRTPPPLFNVKMLRAELDCARRQIPIELQSNPIILSHLHFTELTIHEFALSEQYATSQHAIFSRIDNLYACLMAIKAYFDIIFTLGSRQYLGFHTSIFFQLTHMFFSLYQLTTVEDPVWDKQAVVAVADLSFIGRRLAMNIREVTDVCELELDGPEDMFTRLANLVETATRNWETKIRGKGVQLGQFDAEHTGEETMPLEIPLQPLEMGQDGFWLTDLIAPLEW